MTDAKRPVIPATPPPTEREAEVARVIGRDQGRLRLRRPERTTVREDAQSQDPAGIAQSHRHLGGRAGAGVKHPMFVSMRKLETCV
jgi:hypothetical protein